MPLLCTIKQYGVYGYILEDADPKYRRIFIENQAYDVDTLTPKKEFFQFQSSANLVSSYNAMSANFYEFAPCDTNGKFGSSWSDTRTAWYGGIGKTDPWLLCLDYNYNPRRIFFDDETDTLYFHYYRDISTADIRADWWQAKSLTSTPTYTNTTQSYLVTPLYKWRTTKENKQGNALSVIAFNHDNTATNIARFTYTPGALSTYTNILSTTIPFLIGFDDNGTGFFINYSISTHNYDIYQINADVDIAYASSILKTVTGQGLSSVCYQFPSNIKHSSDTRKVFYSGHWNASNVLAPKRIVWDKNTNSFYDANCTIVYPGANTYSNYGAPPTSVSYTADASNNWWMKPHVFQKGSNNYITFCTTEKCIHGFPYERWNASQLQRNWITFSIGEGTSDNVLTYHSHYSWPTPQEMPRSWVPLNRAGDKMAVMQTGKTVSFEFNTTSGWVVKNTQSVDARSYALDSTGRLYLMTRAYASANQTSTTADVNRGDGWNQIYLFDPLLVPKNVNISIPNQLQQYSGNTIETNLEVSASNKKPLYSFGSIDRFNPSPVSPFANNYSIQFQSANSDRLISTNNDDFNFRTGDFTIEFWMRSATAWTSQSSGAGIVGQRWADGNHGWLVYRNASFTDRLAFRFSNTNIEAVSTGVVDATVWQHWAIVRNSGVITIYRDGTSSNTLTSSADIYDFTGQLNIGFSQGPGAYFNGYISNLRICKGLAVYTGNFTVPTSPLQSTQSSGTNISAITNQCSLLTCNSNRIEDTTINYSTSLKLISLSDNLKFNHGLANLTNDTVVTTNSSGNANVPISITGSGPLNVKLANAIGPTWTTTAGPLNVNPVYESQTVSYTLQTTGDAPITYSIESGSLPSGLSLNTSTGEISGTLPFETSTTTYYFTIRATDVNGYYSGRQFNITNNIDYVTWNNQTNGNILFFSTGTEFTYTLNATSVLNDTITYSTPNTLPSGISISGNTLTGNTSNTNFDANVILSAYSTTTQTRTNVSVRIITSNTVYTIGGAMSTVTEGGNAYNYLTFTSSQSFSVYKAPTSNAQILLVAGGGGGGSGARASGGGGAGGLVNNSISLQNFASYSVVVGSGGTASTKGSNSSISVANSAIYVALGGGYGGQSTGGSGGGASAGNSSDNTQNPGSEALQPTSIWGGSGTSGGPSLDGSGGVSAGGGGGGANTAGGRPYAGAGLLVSWITTAGTDSFNTANTSNTLGYFAGGGGAGTDYSSYLPIPGGVGGGGAGLSFSAPSGYADGNPGLVNTGGGGGGSATAPGQGGSGGSGGSGIVVIKYKVAL
jgi:hypothetical protein